MTCALISCNARARSAESLKDSPFWLWAIGKDQELLFFKTRNNEWSRVLSSDVLSSFSSATRKERIVGFFSWPSFKWQKLSRHVYNWLELIYIHLRWYNFSLYTNEYFGRDFMQSIYLLIYSVSNLSLEPVLESKWYIVTKIDLTYCEKKLI